LCAAARISEAPYASRSIGFSGVRVGDFPRAGAAQPGEETGPSTAATDPKRRSEHPPLLDLVTDRQELHAARRRQGASNAHRTFFHRFHLETDKRDKGERKAKRSEQ
jgi:hypothetical protein